MGEAARKAYRPESNHAQVALAWAREKAPIGLLWSNSLLI
jgi:hypothetical protein